MTRIQQVHCEPVMGYLGHPNYDTGNAISHARDCAGACCSQHITASYGRSVPGQFGTFPEEHSQGGTRPDRGSGLSDMKSYHERFHAPHPDRPFLLDSPPRDGLNTLDILIPEQDTRAGSRDDHGSARRRSKPTAINALGRESITCTPMTWMCFPLGEERCSMVSR